MKKDPLSGSVKKDRCVERLGIFRGYALFRSRVASAGVVVAAGGGLIIRVSPYFWKRTADGARSGPLAVQRETRFPASVARGPPRIAHISGSRPTRETVLLEDVASRPDTPVIQGSRFRLCDSYRFAIRSIHSPSARRPPHRSPHEAGTRVSGEREGSDRSSVYRLDAHPPQVASFYYNISRSEVETRNLLLASTVERCFSR